MSLQHACKVGLTRDFDVLASLVNVNSMKAVKDSLRLEVHYLSNRINQTLRHRRIGTSDSEVFDLSAQRDDLSVDLTSVDASLMCGVHDIEVVENLVDVLSHSALASGCPECWEYQRAVNFLAMARAIPIGIGVINPDVCRLRR
jgi:hypothetical protein